MRIDVARRKWAETRAKKLLSQTPVWDMLQGYLARTRSTGCSFVDYWHLYDAVRKFRPKKILELGTGASTVVLGHVAKEYGAKVTSMEESPQWHEHALENLPSGLPVEIILSETVEDCYTIFRGMRYRNVPTDSYDFVFVDGPSYRTRSGEITFDFDLIRIVANTVSPLRAIIDKRVTTCFVLQRLLPGKVKYVRHLGLGFVGPVTKVDLIDVDRESPSRSFSLGSVVDFAGIRSVRSGQSPQ
jgi:hypothetical protein